MYASAEDKARQVLQEVVTSLIKKSGREVDDGADIDSETCDKRREAASYTRAVRTMVRLHGSGAGAGYGRGEFWKTRGIGFVDHTISLQQMSFMVAICQRLVAEWKSHAFGSFAARAAVQSVVDQLVMASRLPKVPPAQLYLGIARAVYDVLLYQASLETSASQIEDAGNETRVEIGNETVHAVVTTMISGRAPDRFLEEDIRVRELQEANNDEYLNAHLLFHYAGRTTSEIAQLLGLEEDFVKARIAYIDREVQLSS